MSPASLPLLPNTVGSVDSYIVAGPESDRVGPEERPTWGRSRRLWNVSWVVPPAWVPPRWIVVVVVVVSSMPVDSTPLEVVVVHRMTVVVAAAVLWRMWWWW